MNAPLKPHLKLKAFPMANELDTPRTGGVPDFLRKMSTGTSFGNIDASDLKPPRLKVLAGQSPEVLDGVPNALPGNFWVTILNLNLGPSVIGSPILLRKTYQVWAPKTPGSSQSGPLATSSDGINWDVPNQSFEVKFYGNPRIYTWKIGKTVAETGAHKFGSSQDDDPKSKPIATLTYDILWLIDLPNGQKQLVVFTSARTGTKPTQTFISTTKAMGIDQFYQRYRIVVQKKTGPTGRSLLQLRLPVRRRDRQRGRGQGDARPVRPVLEVGVRHRHGRRGGRRRHRSQNRGTRRDYGAAPGREIDEEIPF